MKHGLRILLSCMLPLLATNTRGQIVINELMPTNRGIIADDNADLSDWFEIYLPTGGGNDNLRNYFFSNDRDQPFKWRIPNSTVLTPGTKLLIFASGKNRVASGKIHTNFKLSSSRNNAELIICDTNGNIVDAHTTLGVSSFYSYARIPDGTSNWQMYTKPTPGTTNSGGQVLQGQLSPPSFTPEFGVFPLKGYKLVVSMYSADGATIRYDTSGKQPNGSSAIYTKPITLSKTTVVKARCFKANWASSTQKVQTYFIADTIRTDVVVISAPLIDSITGGSGVYSNNERTGYFELMDKKGKHIKHFECHMSPHGGYSWSFAQKSIRIKLKSYLDSSHCDGDMWAQTGKYLPSVNSFNVRAAGVDWFRGHMRDEVGHTLVQNTNCDIQAARTVTGYLNGSFNGMYHIREREDNDYCYENHGVNADSIDMIAYGSQVQYGSINAWNTMTNTLANYSSASTIADSTFNKIAGTIDWQNWTDYIATETYVLNHDWPGNNIRVWRPWNGNKKWRYALWDIDFGWGMTWGAGPYQPTEDFFGPTMGGGSYPAQGISIMAKNPKFKKYFINRYADLINTVWEYNNVNKVITSFQDTLKGTMPRAFNRWNGQMSPPGGTMTNVAQWNTEVNVMRWFASLRPKNVRSHIKTYFSLTDTVNLTFNVAPANGGAMKVSTIYPAKFPWKGTYFNGNNLNVTAIAKPGYKFSHWSGTAIGGGTDTNETIDRNFTVKGGTLTANFVSQGTDSTMTLAITEINYNSDRTRDAGNWIELKNYGSSNINLSEWRFYTNIKWNKYLFAEGTVIPAKTYWLLCEDTIRFKKQYPSVTAKLIQTNMKLDNNADNLDLIDNTGKSFLKIYYTDAQPWPLAANGYGRTMELVSDTADGSKPVNWFNGCMNGSPGVAFSPCNEPFKISEINYNPPPFANTGDWFELLNYKSTTLDLSGWTVKNSRNWNRWKLPATLVIQPGERLVVCADSTELKKSHPSITNFIQLIGLKLENGSDAIRFYGVSDTAVQFSVAFDDHGSFSIKADGKGYTLELRDSATDFSDGRSWRTKCVAGSPGTSSTSCEGGIVFSEINYKSALFNDAGDWFEIHNTNGYAMNLGGWMVADDSLQAGFTFPAGTVISAYGHLVAVSDSSKFKKMYPNVKNFIGNFGFGISSTGDALQLLNSSSKLVIAMKFNDTLPWPMKVSETGYTIELADSDAFLSDGTKWFKGCLGGSPGTFYSPCSDSVIIAEINYNSNANADASDWVELLNKGKLPVDVSGWIFQDGDIKDTFTIAQGTILPANGRMVIAANKSKLINIHDSAGQVQGDFNFGLSSAGEFMVLRGPNSRLRFGMAYNTDSTWNVFPNGNAFTLNWNGLMSDFSNSKLWVTACPCGSPGFAIGPCKMTASITELNYHSDPKLDAGDWLELKIGGKLPVDLKGARIVNGDNSLQAIIPASTLYFPGDYIALATDGGKFNNIHPGVKKVLINSNFSMKYGGEKIKVYSPGNVILDSVNYSNNSPWPTGAAGNGRTLERWSITADPDKASTWFDGCMKGSPGRAFSPCKDKLEVSEVNYYPSTSLNTGQWIELHNTLSDTIDLGFFTLKNGTASTFIFPANTKLKPYGYLLVGSDIASLQSYFPGVNAIANKSMTFAQNDKLYIYDNAGFLLQAIEWSNASGWPTRADGKGYTLEKVDTAYNQITPAGWFEGCIGGSPGKGYSKCSMPVLSEINYKPSPEMNTGDWLELYNPGPGYADASSMIITNGDSSKVAITPANIVMNSGKYIVIAANSAAFDVQYPGVPKLGVGFDMADQGDKLKAYNSVMSKIWEIDFKANSPWPLGAAGKGYTLERNDILSDPNLSTTWMDGCIGGSPGSKYTPCIDPFVVSEINYNSHKKANTGDWFEIYNNTNKNADLSGWKVKGGNSATTKTFAGATILKPGERMVLSSDTTLMKNSISAGFTKVGFTLNNTDHISFIDNVGKLRMSQNFDSSWANADGSSYTLERNDTISKGHQPEAWFSGCPAGSPGMPFGKCTGRLAISEIAASMENDIPSGDWIETTNPDFRPVAADGWAVAAGSNSYTIANGFLMFQNDRMIIAGDSTKFIAAFPDKLPVKGNFQLSDNGTVTLMDGSGAAVETINYGSASPWPTLTNTGRSLERRDMQAPAQNATSWTEGCIGGSPADAFGKCQYPIVVSEINHTSSPIFDMGDWLEIHNNTNQKLDITGWRVSNGTSFFTVPASTIIAAKGYLVVCSDMAKFSAKWPSVTDNLTGGILTDTAAILKVVDNNGHLKYYINYTSQAPWPSIANGNGPTLELNDTSADPTKQPAWLEGCWGGTPGSGQSIPCFFTSVKNVESNECISLFPNPSKGIFTLSLGNEKFYQLEVYNATGQIVHKENGNISGKHQMRLQTLSAGVYMVRILSNTSMKYAMFEVQ